MPPTPSEEDSNLETELRRLQTVRASFEILKGYTDAIAASVEGALENFTAVNGYAKRLEAVVETAQKEGEQEKRESREKGKEKKQ